MAGAAATTTPEQLRERLGRIKHVVLVLSGKGGVGKSTVAVEMACALARGCEASADGGGAAAAPPMRVGLLDLDLCGPSVPHLLKLDDHSVHQSGDGWLPVIADPQQKVNLSVMSIGFLVGKNDPVIWRGPKKTAMVQQFIADVSWDVDVLVIDTPPGTSDEHISVVEALTSGCSPDGAVLVTTPQGVSLSDVRREASFCVKAGIPVLGVVENMSGFVCPHCSECTNIFATGGGEKLAADIGAPFFGRIPIDPSLQQSQRSLLEALPQAAVFDAVQTVAANLRAALARKDQSGGD